MTLFPRLMVGVYGGLLRLYPRKFQQEFREEMHDVFTSAVKDAKRAGTLSLLRLLFFEMLDFPINLVIEHFSQWRKEWSMKDTRHGIRPFRAAEMGAIGLLIGWVIILLSRKYMVLPNWWYKADLGMLLITLREVVVWALASALLGLMLCLSVSAGFRLALRVCLLMAGLEVVATIIGTLIVRSPLINFAELLKGNWQIAFIALINLITIMIDGLFTGAGLGLASGGWKSCKRFALTGMLAYGIGFIIGETVYQLWVSSDWIWSTGYPATGGNFVFVISVLFYGILTGGILGWFWGKENPVGMLKEKIV